MVKLFHTCEHCGQTWSTRTEFLADGGPRVVGYAADTTRIRAGIIMFLHRVSGCDKTFTMRIGEFMDLYNGPKFARNQANSPKCPGLCLTNDFTTRCDLKCRCAIGRETAVIVMCTQDAARRTALFEGRNAIGDRLDPAALAD